MKPLSISGVRLKRKLAEGIETQLQLAAYLQCDQTTISKWITKGATPSLAMAFAIEARWPEIRASEWLVLSTDLDARPEAHSALQSAKLRRDVREVLAQGALGVPGPKRGGPKRDR